MITAELSLFVEVTDPALLYAKAKEQLLRDGMSPDEIDEYLDDDGEVDLGRCLGVVCDNFQEPPGFEILDSSAEVDYS